MRAGFPGDSRTTCESQIFSNIVRGVMSILRIYDTRTANRLRDHDCPANRFLSRPRSVRPRSLISGGTWRHGESISRVAAPPAFELTGDTRHRLLAHPVRAPAHAREGHHPASREPRHGGRPASRRPPLGPTAAACY